MIAVSFIGLPRGIETSLAELQRRVDQAGDFPACVKAARGLFKAQNVPSNATFTAVRRALVEMCAGARRCMYCEDSAADEIEHFRPKSSFPEHTFLWENLLYVCGQCNTSKGNRFAITTEDGNVEHIVRSRRAAIRPPVGLPLLLSPRTDNPLAYIELDLVDTFAFVPSVSLSHADEVRARYTIESLKLNRDLLLRARREAFRGYNARLSEYVGDKLSSVTQAETYDAGLLSKGHHPTVWAEMQRQRHLLPSLNDLFAQAPELLSLEFR